MSIISHSNRMHFLFTFLISLTFLSLLLAPSVHGREANAEKEGILLVAFGTSVPEARSAFTKIDEAYRKAFPDRPIEWAFTSHIIRKKLAAMGIVTHSVPQALERLARQGVKNLRAQSLHVLPGAEFAEFARQLLNWSNQNPGRLKSIWLGRPLLESRKDAEITAQATLGSLNKHREKGTALVLMAHGNENGRAGLAMEGMRNILKTMDPLTFIASVEGEHSFNELLETLNKSGARKVLLAPFMLVAGDHARNDLGGDAPDSWANMLRQAGYPVDILLEGLGEQPGIAELFLKHTRQDNDNLLEQPVD